MDDISILVRARRLEQSARVLREGARLSLRELAQAIGVDAATVSRWETGKTRPRAAAAVRWVCALVHLADMQGVPEPQYARRERGPPDPGEGSEK